MTWAPTVVADPLAALVGWLRTQLPTLEGRAYGDRLPGAETDAMPRSGAVLRQAGGPGMARHLPLVAVRVDVHAFGATPYLAASVHWLVAAALTDLRRVTTGGTLLHSCVQEVGPMAQTDPDTEWPEVVSSWQLLTADRVPA